LGRKFFPADAIFLHLPRSAPGSGDEERSDEPPEPGVERQAQGMLGGFG